MNTANKSTGRKLDRFLSDLSALVDTLPSPDVKAQVDRELGSLIEFLQDFRDRLKSLPTDKDADGVAATIEAVRDCVRIAEADPVMSRILGLSPEFHATRKPVKGVTTERDREAAKSIARELKDMPPGEVEQALADKGKYNVSMLRQVGGELGIRLPSKSTRLAMIDRISKALANRWGYDYLSHGGVKHVAPTEVHDR